MEHGEWEFEIGASWPSLRLLYGWVFTKSKALLMLVPIGGVSFIIGWELLALAAWRGTAKPRFQSIAPPGSQQRTTGGLSAEFS